MGIFFTKQKPPSRVTEQDKAVLQLKQTRDKIKQYQKRIEQNIERDIEIASKLLKKNQKDRALLLLRKKKFQEQILVKTDGQLENLEHIVHDLEFAQVEIQVIEGLKVGNESLKKLHALMSIQDIEKILDETREGIDKQQEIDELLSGALTDEDENDVEEELNVLILEDTIIISELSTDVLLPDVPEDVPSIIEASKNKIEKPVTLQT